MLVLTTCKPSDAIERQLRRLDFSWEMDAEGDYRIPVPLPDGSGEAVVGLGTHAGELGHGVWIREIWSVAVRIPGALPEELAENLLSDSWSSRTGGSWAIAGVTSDGETVLVYLNRIPADASRHFLKAALIDAAVSASSLNTALAYLEESD